MGVVAAGPLQFLAVRRKRPTDPGNVPFVIGQQGTQVVIQILYLFPVGPHAVYGADHRLDEVIGRFVGFRHLGGECEVVRILIVIDQILGNVMLIPQKPVHAADHLLDRAIIVL